MKAKLKLKGKPAILWVPTPTWYSQLLFVPDNHRKGPSVKRHTCLGLSMWDAPGRHTGHRRGPESPFGLAQSMETQTSSGRGRKLPVAAPLSCSCRPSTRTWHHLVRMFWHASAGRPTWQCRSSQEQHGFTCFLDGVIPWPSVCRDVRTLSARFARQASAHVTHIWGTEFRFCFYLVNPEV